MLVKLLAFASIFVIPVLAMADDNMAADAGPFEVLLSGTGQNDRAFRNGSVTADGAIGFFVMPFLELSARDGVTYADLGHGSTFSNDVRGAVDLNIPLDRFEPFIGGNVGYFAGQGFNSPEAAPEVGLKIFITKSVFLFGEGEYDFFWNRNNTTFDTGEFGYNLGFGIRF